MKAYWRSRGCMYVQTVIAALLVAALSPAAGAQGTPPFPDGLWDLSPTIITDTDRTGFREAVYGGERERHMWLIRGDAWTSVDHIVHVFDVDFDRIRVEFQVHPELGDEADAREEVETYAPMIGRLPRALLEHLREVEIQQNGLNWAARGYDKEPSAGVIHISIEAADAWEARGLDDFMDELLFHEAVHVSLDPIHRDDPGYFDAQYADRIYISNHARRRPYNEDLAETLLAWFAVRYRPERISPAQHQAIIEAVPNRLAYLDQQNFDMSPYRRATPVPTLPLSGIVLLAALLYRVGRGRRGEGEKVKGTARGIPQRSLQPLRAP